MLIIIGNIDQADAVPLRTIANHTILTISTGMQILPCNPSIKTQYTAFVRVKVIDDNVLTIAQAENILIVASATNKLIVPFRPHQYIVTG